MSKSGARYAAPGEAFGGPEWAAGRYYGHLPGVTRANSTAWTGGTLYFTRTWVPLGTGAADRIRVGWSAAGTAGALVRLGVYGLLANYRPGALLLDAGTVDGTQAAGEYEITIALSGLLGPVWLAGVIQGAPATAPAMAYWATGPSTLGKVTLATLGVYGLASSSNAFTGALPDPAPTGFASPTQGMDIALRAA